MKRFALIPAMILMAGVMVTNPSAQSSTDATQLARLSESATTPAAHADVARQYRSLAADLNAKATKHEAEVKRLAKLRQPLDFKNPTLSDRAISRERQQAMDARRGASEASTQAQLHTQLAVELMASR